MSLTIAAIIAASSPLMGACANEVCVMKGLTSGPRLPNDKVMKAARESAIPYFTCVSENLLTLTSIWPSGDDIENVRWVVDTVWSVCSKERAVATVAIAGVFQNTNQYATPEDVRKAADRYRSGVTTAIFGVRFMKIGKFVAFKAL